jgi:hypothetical protein
MEKVNNIFTVDTVTIDGSYIKLTGVYQIPESSPFERGDILTEDKYDGHQIYVAFATKDDNGKNGLVLDNKSMNPTIKKPFNEKLIKNLKLGIHLFKIED